MLLGLIKPTKGNIEFGDFSISGYTNNVPFFSKVSISENMEYFFDKIEKDKLDTYLKNFSVEKYMNRKVNECSLGMRQKALLTFTLASNTDLIILDEPTSNLDFTNRSFFFDIIKSKLSEGKSIILSTNVLNEEFFLILSDYIIAINNKKIKLIHKKDIDYNYVINFENKNTLDIYLNDNPDLDCVVRGNFVFIEKDKFNLDTLPSIFKKYKAATFKKEYLLGEYNED